MSFRISVVQPTVAVKAHIANANTTRRGADVRRNSCVLITGLLHLGFENKYYNIDQIVAQVLTAFAKIAGVRGRRASAHEPREEPGHTMLGRAVHPAESVVI